MEKAKKIKIFVGLSYLILLSVFLFLFFSKFSLQEITSYNFIKENRLYFLDLKNTNLFLVFTIFLAFTILWVFPFLGFGSPVALLGGFIFGKWLGTFLIVTGNTVGAVLIYLLAKNFLKSFIEKNLSKKFSKFIIFFNRNDLFYYLFFRLVGGGGTPFAIQNLIPVIFNMSVKKYFIATYIGVVPTTFVTVALGSGIATFIDENNELSFLSVISTPEIYLPIAGFIILIPCFFILKKILFK